MNEYPGPGVGGFFSRFLLLMVAAVIVLSIVVSVIKALWPWLLGIGLAVAAIAFLVRLRGRAHTRW